MSFGGARNWNRLPLFVRRVAGVKVARMESVWEECLIETILFGVRWFASLFPSCIFSLIVNVFHYAILGIHAFVRGG